MGEFYGRNEGDKYSINQFKVPEIVKKKIRRINSGEDQELIILFRELRCKSHFSHFFVRFSVPKVVDTNKGCG